MDATRVKVLIRNLDSQIEARHRAMAEQLGLSVAAIDVLEMLYVKDNRLASDLAHSVGRAPTSFTPILDRLQVAGYVERKPDPKDRRAVRLILTQKARNCQKWVLDGLSVIDVEVRDLLNDRVGEPVRSGFWEEVLAPLDEESV